MVEQQGKRVQTFQEFKANFYGAFDDPAVFDCQEFNLLKIVQDGLKCAYNYSSPFGKPMWYMRLFLFLRQIKSRVTGQTHLSISALSSKLSKLKGREYIILDDGTHVKDSNGNDIPVFTARILEVLKRDNCVYGRECPARAKPETGYDFDLPSLVHLAYQIPVAESDQALYQALCATLERIRQETRFSEQELEYIRLACHNFWTLYRVSRFVFSHLSAHTCFLNCHYHKEGTILAMKRAGIHITELQHGLIASSDIFYLYPPKVQPVVDRALFADDMMAYGPYWKEVLAQGVEYPQEKIQIGGFYLYEQPEASEELRNILIDKGGPEAKIILITTQTKLYKYFNEYIVWLSADLERRGEPALILVKPHPAVPSKNYEMLASLPRVVLTHESVSGLFLLADYHISIYSTTLYEALRHQLPNFSLYYESCADYLKDILDVGVAMRLEPTQNPIDIGDQATSSLDSTYFFAPFQIQLLQKSSLISS